MPASALDSAIYRELFGDAEVARLFTDTAEVRAMLLVEGALAEVQGELGLIPETAARAIHRAAMELQVDPGALAAETGRNAVPVPALVAAFRAEMKAPRTCAVRPLGRDEPGHHRHRADPAAPQGAGDRRGADRRGADRVGDAGRDPCRGAHGRAHLRTGGDAHELRGGGGGLGRSASPAAGRA
jgi:hypothetical protein